MYSNPSPLSYLILLSTAATVLISACPAQEVASLDLTQVVRRADLRRPKATSPVTGGYSGIEHTTPCFNSKHTVGALHTSLLSLDRTYYQLEDEPTFEVTVQNAGSTSIRIPFSPHLADLQHEDPAEKFAYSELHVTLWIGAGDYWRTNTGGGVTLYGAEDHANTMLTLNPGEWVRIIGKGHLTLVGSVHNDMSTNPVDRVYAEASVFHEETLITPTQSATVSREVCLAQTHGESIPIRLTIP